MQNAGVILDVYDDSKGLVLREKLAGQNLPPQLAQAQLLSREKLASLPDRLFALVAYDGAQVMRKYAVHDGGHCATSIVYFLECGHLLPEEAQKVAAVNLVNACAWYDIDPPEPLVKVALIGKALNAGMLGLQAKGSADQAMGGFGKVKSDMNQYRQIQATAQVPAEGSHIDKQADLTGTEMMPMSGVTTKPLRSQKNTAAKPQSGFVGPKVSSQEWFGPIDITGLSAPVETYEAASEHHCLPGRYPIDSYGQVKQAEAYFEEHYHTLDLPDRRTYAFNLVGRANDLGVKVAGTVLDYAGHRLGRHLPSELLKRASTYREHDAGRIYEELQTKVASMAPDDVVRALHLADSASGAAHAYGKPVVGFRDPFAAVFGVKVAKEQITGEDDASDHADHEAAAEFVWNRGSDYVTGDQLRFMANRNEELDGVLGEGFSKEYSKDPVGTFKALPDPQKHVLARLASDNSGGSSRQ